jgi:S-adenosyl-L-methionine hydrolase (adenosine-forming)
LKFITLLTDFGTTDGYPGIMKGVIWGIAPDAQIADISHQVAPQDIFEGAFALSRAVPFFPSETVHIVVVDPGVGTSRRPIAARIDSTFFVGPDNGIFSLILHQAKAASKRIEIVHLNQPRFWLPVVSNVFHGRDIFAPVGAHIANGVPLIEMGTVIDDPVMLDFPNPQKITGGWKGEIIHIDSFGNLATNLEQQHLPENRLAVVRIAGREIRGIVRSFGDGAEGNLVALVDSAGKLSVAVVNGNAALKLKVNTHEPVELVVEES